MNNFLKIYTDLKNNGKIVYPRGLKVLEIENYEYELPPYIRFANFASRKLNIGYIKEEFKWYLKGDKYDVSIAEKAKLWKSMITKEGTINSNYGQYIFKQFDKIVNVLKEDKDSRRASIVILNQDHVVSDDADLPCTYSMNFRIRDNKLNMTVRMRSQDAIYGLGNDAPSFSFIHEMVFISLKEKYPDLVLGNYHHSVDSFHIYERHFEMLEKILNGDEFTKIECPKMLNIDEVSFLRKLNFTNIPLNYFFTKWLNNV